MTNLLFILLILTCLLLSATGRIATSFRIVAVQGAGLSLLPLLIHAPGYGLRSLVLVILTAGLKGFLVPRLLSRTQEQAALRQESIPFLGSSSSIILGVTSVGIAMWLGRVLSVAEIGSSMLVPAALSMVFLGLLLMAVRPQAISQVVGYVVFGNGISVFGVELAQHEPLLVELALVMDVLVTIFWLKFAQFQLTTIESR